VKLPFKNYIPFWLGKKLRGGTQKFLGFYYKGDLFYCPFCKNHFRKFLPGGFNFPVLTEKQIVGGGYRENLICPRCYSKDRDRLIYLFLKNKTTIFREKQKVFHVAPEGWLKTLLTSLPNIEYMAGVKYLEGYYYDRRTNLVDITNLPYEDCFYDAIICSHVLEHIQNDKKAISELYRILKPGGFAILQVPLSKTLKETYEDPSVVSPDERENVFGQFDHVRIYGQDYRQKIENAGFILRLYNPVREKWSDDIAKYALNPDEDLYVAYK
jgi:hypothetical protein